MSSYAPGHFDGDGCTVPDPGHFAYADPADAMRGEFDPKTPCSVMPTRPCVVWNDGEDRWFPIERCPATCWRYDVPADEPERFWDRDA